MVYTIIENVDSNATLINLDQSKAFDRVNHGFLESVLSVAGFGFHFRCWIRLLYASSGVIRLKPFNLTRSIHQAYPLSRMLYVLTLELFLRRFRLNPVLCDLTLPGSTEVARYTA